MKKFLIGLVAALATVGLVGCSDQSAATTSSYCGYTMGNGEVTGGQAQSREIKKVLRPNETQGYDSDYDQVKYFPCGQRNFRVAPGNGDQQTPLHAWTAKGTPVDVWVSMYWTPNQSEDGLRQFITFCEKYACAQPSLDAAAGANFSSPGWNGMLGENVGPTLQRIAERAVSSVGEEVWTSQDPKARDAIAKSMQEAFSAEFQKTTGFTTDIICGSGSGGPKEKYDCEQVRIVVDGVYAQGGLQDQANQAAAAQRERDLKAQQQQADIDFTNALYGPLGPAYRACRDLAGQCRMILGTNGPVIVQP